MDSGVDILSGSFGDCVEVRNVLVGLDERRTFTHEVAGVGRMQVKGGAIGGVDELGRV